MAAEKCAQPNSKCDTADHQAAESQEYCSSYCAIEAQHAGDRGESGYPDCTH